MPGRYTTAGGTDYQPDLLEWNIGPITVTQNGTVYFRNGSLLSKITPDGKLSNLAGSFSWSPDPKDGFGADAILDGDYRWGQTMAADKNGNIYLCDTNAIRKVSPAGQVTTLAGKLGWDESEGHVDGTGTIARFNNPTGIAVDDAGVIYVMDSGNFVIRKLQPDGTTSTFVGNATIINHFDAKGAKARLNRPRGLTIDSSGNLYFADLGTIRKVKPDGTVTTIAGKLNPEHGALRIRGQMGIQEAAGEAAIFGEDDVTGLAVDRRGTLYASFENSIYEAESIAAPPFGTPFPTPVPLPTTEPKPTPTPAPNPAPTPELLSLTLSTTSVDLTNGAVDVPFTITASGKISYASVYFGGFGVSVYEWSPSSKANGSINIPSYTKEGTYNLSSLYYSWGNYPNNQYANFYGDSIPNAFKDISITVTNPLTDSTPPIIHSLVLLSTEANASTSSAKIRYRIQISDDLSGFNSLNLNFSGPIYYSNISSYIGAWNSLVAVEGTLKTYEGTIEIPQGSAEGDWILESISVSDQAGNSGSVSLTPELQAVKFTVSSSATNPTEPQYQYAPWLVGLTLDKASVDVTAADQKVKVQLAINNDDLPTNHSIYLNFNLVGENAYGNGNSISPSDFKLVSGTVANGVYEGMLIIPRYAKNGNYTISNISIYENNQPGESKSYNKWNNSIPAEFRKTITIIGTQDVTAPVLQNLVVSPASADTRNGAVLVTANLTITDDLSGLQDKQWSRAGALALRSPSGKEFLWSEFTLGNRFAGNSTNGTYQVQFELPQYSEEGAWTIDYIELVDRNYNTRFLIPANLTAQQLAATTIQVQGWTRGWETLSSNPQTSNQAKAVITKQSAKFWFPIANIDGNWTWGTGEGGYSFQGDYLEYDWSVEILRNPKYWLSFTHLKKTNETAQSGNFTEFLAAGQVNVWEDSADGGTIIESASISASRNGTCLLIELTDSAVLSKLQKAMPTYVPFLSFDPSSGSYNNQNVKVEYVKEDVQLSLGNLTHTADGTDKIPSVTSTPGNHTQDVTITYNGTTSPPSEPGTYTVVAFLNAANYKGRQVATMMISSPTQTPTPIAPPPAPSGGGGGGAPPPSIGGSPAVKKSKKGSKSLAKKSGSGSKKSAASKSSGGKKSGGKKKKK